MKYYVGEAGKGRHKYYRAYSCSNDKARRLRKESVKIYDNKRSAEARARELNR